MVSGLYLVQIFKLWPRFHHVLKKSHSLCLLQPILSLVCTPSKLPPSSPQSPCQFLCFSSTLCVTNLFNSHCFVSHLYVCECQCFAGMPASFCEPGCVCGPSTLPCFNYGHRGTLNSPKVTFWLGQMPCGMQHSVVTSFGNNEAYL